jgi:SulP family sulfate permease
MTTEQSRPRQKEPSRLAQFIPMLQWAPQYDRTWLRPDLIAGLTVAALVVPKALGYAGIASVPIQHGLYAAAAGAILYALFGTSRQISTGPSSALAAVAGSAVLFAGVSDDENAVALVAAITLVTGILFLLLALLKMGWISQFLSKAVITGFLFGAAIEVVIGELPKITGTSVEGSNSWQKLASWIRGLPDLWAAACGPANSRGAGAGHHGSGCFGGLRPGRSRAGPRWRCPQRTAITGAPTA